MTCNGSLALYPSPCLMGTVISGNKAYDSSAWTPYAILCVRHNQLCNVGNKSLAISSRMGDAKCVETFRR